MTIRAPSMSLLLAAIFAIGTPAMALNPQPEPPMPYKGYEYVINIVQPNEWRWVIERRLPGRAPAVLESGLVHGGHGQAIARARAAIDRIAGAGHSTPRPAIAPAQTHNRP